MKYQIDANIATFSSQTVDERRKEYCFKGVDCNRELEKSTITLGNLVKLKYPTSRNGLSVPGAT